MAGCKRKFAMFEKLFEMAGDGESGMAKRHQAIRQIVDSLSDEAERLAAEKQAFKEASQQDTVTAALRGLDRTVANADKRMVEDSAAFKEGPLNLQTSLDGLRASEARPETTQLSSDLQQAVNKVDSDVEALGRFVATDVDAKLGALQPSVNSLSGKVTDFAQSVSTNIASVGSDVGSKIEAQAASMADISSRVAALETVVASLAIRGSLSSELEASKGALTERLGFESDSIRNRVDASGSTLFNKLNSLNEAAATDMENLAEDLQDVGSTVETGNTALLS